MSKNNLSFLKMKQLEKFKIFKKLLQEFTGEVKKKNFEKYADLSIELKKIFKTIESDLDAYIEGETLKGTKEAKRITGHSFSRLELGKFYLNAFINLKQTLHKDYLKISLNLLDKVMSKLEE